MKLSSTRLLLLTTGLYGVAGRVLPLTDSIIFDTNISTTEALHIATVDSNRDGRTLTPQKLYNGWINPDDLTPMPQCIAQQDQSAWLSTMTKCTSKRCTSHFWFICTHQQWLTQLSCLSIGFSPDVIAGYVPYCGRSILAKAQLYLWIRNITGRTWLVDVGDTNGLQNLSPTSLAKGYTAFDVSYNAPTCLTGSVSALSMEPFQHVIASCSFTSTTQHTGNADRPWEYRESLRSIIPLDFETVGYNLTGGSIEYGDYFDKECFCSAFTIDPKTEPCSRTGQLDLTKERLWINATCGSTSLPDNWTDGLQTTEFAYIPIEDWYWPRCVVDMPKQVIELTNQCATDACELDSSGYCKVKRAVDRACFCRDISYDSCSGSCHIFETRIDYVEWLHNLCSNVRDWHGLPDNWRQLAAPTTLEMIPWRWTIQPSNDSNIDHTTHLGSIGATATCASNEWKLGSFALVNIATFIAVFLSQRISIHPSARSFLQHPHPWYWFSKGTLIAAFQLLPNLLNAFLVQTTPGYEDVPVAQLMLLWCSMPRLVWLTILRIGVQPSEEKNSSAVTSGLFAEIVLQFLSSYYMVMTVNYGRQHNFYIGGLARAERSGPARMMYAGALMWLIIVGLTLVQLIRATRRINSSTGSGSLDLPEGQRYKQINFNIAEKLMAQLNQCCMGLRENLAHYGMDNSRISEETPLTSSQGREYSVYGTIPVKGQKDSVPRKASVDLYSLMVMSMLLLWIAQWLFWSGFVDLSSEEFCLPKLRVLTVVWTAFSSIGAIVGAT